MNGNNQNEKKLAPLSIFSINKILVQFLFPQSWDGFSNFFLEIESGVEIEKSFCVCVWGEFSNVTSISNSDR